MRIVAALFLLGCSTDAFVSPDGSVDAGPDATANDSAVPDTGKTDAPPDAGCAFDGPAPGCGNNATCGSPNACCVSTGETCDTVCVAAAAFYCVRPADCHGSDGAIEACCLSGDAPQPGCPLQFDTNVSTLCSVGSLCPMGALHVCVANGDCGMVETCKPATIGTNTTFTFGVCQ